MNRVLFVDDEPFILNALRRGLINEPYKQFYAPGGEAALKVMEETEISVLVTDMRMPGMSGLELLKIARERYPDMVKLVLSGYTQLPQVLVTVNQGDIFKFITKPWNMDSELRGIILEAVDYYNYRMAIRKAKDDLERKNASFQNILKSYDDKLMLVKDEVLMLQEMYRKWFRLIEKWGWGGDPETDGFGSLNWVPLETLSVIPTQVKRVTLGQFVEGFRKSLVDVKTVAQIEISLAPGAPASLKGRWEAMEQLLRSLLLLLLRRDAEGKIQVILEALHKTPEASQFSITLEGKKSLFQTAPARARAVGWLAELTARLGGSLTAHEQEDRRSVTIMLPFEE